MENITISLNDNQVIIKRYKVRQVGNQSATIETTIPKEVFEREARRNGMTLQEALSKLIAVWRFDGFEGLHLSFEMNDKKIESCPEKRCNKSKQSI